MINYILTFFTNLLHIASPVLKNKLAPKIINVTRLQINDTHFG